MKLNLLWPRWAELVAHLSVRTIRKRGWPCYDTVHAAGNLLADRLDFERTARLHRERPFVSSRGARWIMLALLTLGALSLPARANALDKWFWGLQAAGAADLVSTEIWLHQGGPEAAELNPLGQHVGARVAMKVGYNAFAWWAARKLERDRHERWANVVRGAALSVQLGVSSWNVSLTLRR